MSPSDKPREQSDKEFVDEMALKPFDGWMRPHLSRLLIIAMRATNDAPRSSSAPSRHHFAGVGKMVDRNAVLEECMAIVRGEKAAWFEQDNVAYTVCENIGEGILRLKSAVPECATPVPAPASLGIVAHQTGQTPREIMRAASEKACEKIKEIFAAPAEGPTPLDIFFAGLAGMGSYNALLKLYDHARQLERELAAANRALERQASLLSAKDRELEARSSTTPSELAAYWAKVDLKVATAKGWPTDCIHLAREVLSLTRSASATPLENK